MQTVIPIKLSFSNAYLVKGERPILVDTGLPGEEDRILHDLAEQGVRPKDIALIFLTHGHVDHYGSAVALRQKTGAPIALHQADLPFALSGTHPFHATGFQGQLFVPVFQRKLPLPPIEPDFIFENGFDLKPFGINAQVIHTPGHSAGHVALLLPDGAALVGDLMRGGHMGGMLLPSQPEYPYYADDLPTLRDSIRAFMGYQPQTLYVGHGGPLQATAVTKRFSSLLNPNHMIGERA